MLNGMFKIERNEIPNSPRIMIQATRISKLGLFYAREAAGLTQDQVARKLKTKKSAISRIENHADDVRLSTIRRYAKAVGANLQIRLSSSQRG
jgi:DNA-binding XRE family transcriptional regulator